MSPVKIYVGNIPSAARSSELKELFEKFGKVVECDILKDFGFVHMDDTNDAKAAIAGLNDTLWKGARIRVEISTTKTNKGEPSQRRKMRQAYDSRSRYPMRGDSRGPPLPPPPHHRDAPYPPPPPHLPPPRSSRESSRAGGPIRDSRYSGSSSGRYMSDRSRPYPDDYRSDRGRLPPSPLPPRDYGPSSYRGGGGSSLDMRDHRMGNGMPDPYPMRGGHLPPPPPHHMHAPPMHDPYYRGGPPPPMPPPRYDYDHYSNSRGGGPAPVSSSSSSRASRYRDDDRYRTAPRYRSRTRSRSRSPVYSPRRPRSPPLPPPTYSDDYYRSKSRDSYPIRDYPSSRPSEPERDKRPPVISSSTNSKRENNSSYTSSSSTSSLSSAGSDKSNRSRN